MVLLVLSLAVECVLVLPGIIYNTSAKYQLNMKLRTD